jgi:hypothetical protein
MYTHVSKCKNDKIKNFLKELVLENNNYCSHVAILTTLNVGKAIKRKLELLDVSCTRKINNGGPEVFKDFCYFLVSKKVEKD